MTRDEAIRELAQITIDALAGAPADKVLRAYDSLAVVMPTQKEREAAERVAFTLREAESLQLKFNGLINGGAR